MKAADFLALGRTVDAVIFHGRDNPRLLAAPAGYLADPDYVTEIRRRIAILATVFGGDFWSEELNDQLSKGGSR